MNTTNNKGVPSDSTPSKTPRDYSSNAQAQCKRLFDWLKEHGQIDTITARRELDILGVAQRISDLRHKLGYDIDTVSTQQETECGKPHRVAMYVLKSEVRHD